MDDRKRILIVDDDIDSMRPLARILERGWGFDVSQSAEMHVLELIKRIRFDLIILDFLIQPITLNDHGEESLNIFFSGVNWRRTALEFYARLREGQFTGRNGTDPNVPVIFCSAISAAQFETLDFGPTDNVFFLEKPFDVVDASELIMRVSGESYRPEAAPLVVPAYFRNISSAARRLIAWLNKASS